MRDALLNKTHSEIEIIETLRNNNNILSAQLIGICIHPSPGFTDYYSFRHINNTVLTKLLRRVTNFSI